MLSCCLQPILYQSLTPNVMGDNFNEVDTAKEKGA